MKLKGVWSTDKCDKTGLIDRSWCNSNFGNIPEKESIQKMFFVVPGLCYSMSHMSLQLPLPLLLLQVSKENINTVVLTSILRISSVETGLAHELLKRSGKL